MQRWKLTVEYDGRPFVGWQRQDNGPSVQQSLEEAVQRLSGEVVRVHGSGRTDAGVHALGQVCHFDLEKPFTGLKLRDALNFHLKPAPIAVLEVEAVAEDFHARLTSTGRAYVYRIVNRRAPLALDAGRAWHVTRPLDAEAMHAAAQMLVGQHDFTSFRAALCQAKSPVKTLDRLDVESRCRDRNPPEGAAHHRRRDLPHPTQTRHACCSHILPFGIQGLLPDRESSWRALIGDTGAVTLAGCVENSNRCSA